jgi:hypothetical protein
MNKENKKMYDSAISDLLIGINNKYKSWNPSKTYKPDGLVLSISPGRKFDKVIHDNSVWGFVAKTDGMLKGIPYFVGDVFKAAGWRAPAKHVRGSIFDSSSDWYAWTGPNYLI